MDTVQVSTNSVVLPSFRHSAEYPVGLSLVDILDMDLVPRNAWQYFSLAINGSNVPQDNWGRVKPKAGALVTVTVHPGVGENALVDRGTLRVLGFLVATLAGNAIPGLLGLGGLYGGILRTALTFLGIFIVSSLIDPPEPEPEGKYYTISGVRNRIRQYQPVPKVYGKIRVFPDLAAVPVTELIGDDQYINLLFCVGMAPLRISELKIGNAPIRRFRDVEYRISDGWRDFDDIIEFFSMGQDPFEENIGEDLLFAPSWVDIPEDDDLLGGQSIPYNWLPSIGYRSEVVTFTTQADSIRISLDLVFPQGLYYRDQNGSIHSDRCDVSIRYRPVGSTGGEEDWAYVYPSWVPANQIEELNILTETELFKNLAILNKNLKDVVQALNLISQLERIVAAKLKEWVEEQVNSGQIMVQAMQRRGTLTFTQEAELTDLQQTMSDLSDVVGSASVVTQNLANTLGQFNAVLSAVIIVVEAVDDLLALREYLHQGYGPELANLPWFSRWLIKKRNLGRLFGNPQTGTFILVNEDTRVGLFRRGIVWPVPKGEYEVQIRRVNRESESSDFHSRVQVGAVRSFRPVRPVSSELSDRLALIAVRIKANEDLSGSLDQFNVIAESPLRWHDGTGWRDYALEDDDGGYIPTNPAWQFCDALIGNGSPVGITEDQVDITTVLDVAAHCLDKGFQHSVVVATAKVQIKMLNDILRLARGSFRMEGRGRYSIAYDRARDTYDGVLSDRNTGTSFSASKSMVDTPDAILVKFANPDKGYATDEMYVYADGFGPSGVETGGSARFDGGGLALSIPFQVYRVSSVYDTVLEQFLAPTEYHIAISESLTEITRDDGNPWEFGDKRYLVKYTYFGVSPATVEKLEIPGIIDTHRQSSEHHTGMCYKLGRYMLAVAKLRPEVFEETLDYEHLQYDKGNRLLYQKEILLWGLVGARITDMFLVGDELLEFTIDESVTLSNLKEYAFEVRTAVGQIFRGDIQNPPGTTSVFYFASPGLDVSEITPQVGDLIIIGEKSKVGVPVIVTEVSPVSVDNARVTMVEDNPAIHEAEDILIPEYDPSITVGDLPEVTRPPRPIIMGYVADETAMVANQSGVLQSRLLLNVVVNRNSVDTAPVSAIQVGYRFSRESNPSGPLIVVGKPDSTDYSFIGWRDLTVHTSGTTQIAVFPVEDMQYYDVRVRTLTELGVPSEWYQADGLLVTGRYSTPPNVQFVSITGTTLNWQYNPPIDLAGFEIRTFVGEKGGWEHGAVVGTTGATARSFRSDEYFSGGPRTIMIKAFDQVGLYSEREGRILIPASDPMGGSTVVRTEDHRALGWPGERLNLEVGSGGDLEEILGSKEQFYRLPPTAFYRDSSRSFYETIHPGFIYVVEFQLATGEYPCEASVSLRVSGGHWKLLVVQDISPMIGSESSQLIQDDGQALMFNVPQMVEQVYRGRFRPEEGVRYTFIVSGEPDDDQSVIEEFHFILDRL
jgi:hypothetical protein